MVNHSELIGINYKKLKKIRKEKNFLLKEVAKRVGITDATLSRYENGMIKRSKLETLKKICDLYEVDYRNYIYNSQIDFCSISAFLNFILTSPELIKDYIAILNFLKINTYFVTLNSKKNFKALFNSLTEDEKNNFLKFKQINDILLNSNEIFLEKDILKKDIMLFSYFYEHKLRKEIKDLDKIFI